MAEINHSVNILEGQSIQVEGVDGVVHATESQIKANIVLGGLLITGANLHVERLDLDQKILHASGTIHSLKYLNAPKSIMKRIFK